MEIYQIKSLNCKDKKNRKKILKEVMKVVHTKEKPTKKELETICKSISKKYSIKIHMIKYSESGGLSASIRVKDAYSAIYCDTYYELLCKFILYVEKMRKYV